MRIADIQQGASLPNKEFSCDIAQLFLYNAVLFNAHRIHYDYPYATDVEGYADLVLAGPLIGDWLHQCVVDWVGESGHLQQMEYSNRHAAYVGETLFGSGVITRVNNAENSVEVQVQITNAKGDVVAPGKAIVQLGA